MLVNPKPIQLASARDVNAHLDRWAQDRLADPDAWAAALAATRDWADYSPRNQVLLASYRAAGPVAGIETWRLVPAADGGACAVRSGEHGLPVRVPVTTTAAEPDPHLGRARPTSAAVEAWEWRGVFCLEQLARRPDPAQLHPPGPPDLNDADFHKAATGVAKRTMRGRAPRMDDPMEILATAAGRQQRSANRPHPEGPIAAQAAWLTAERLGRTAGDLPGFDPGDLVGRDRWETLADVLDASRKLTAGFAKQLGVDLLASPLPRMEIHDDRVVPAGRRNRLPRASLEQLPVGRWVEVGPYTQEEWAARGETATGKAAYLRLNTTAYLVAIENGATAGWRLEDTRAKTGAGLIDGGDEASLEDAKSTGVATMRDRYPQLAPKQSEPDRPLPALAEAGWEELADRPGSYRRRLDHDVTAYVLEVAGQWLPMVQRPGEAMLEPVGPSCASRDDAVAHVTFAGKAACRDAALESRIGFDDSVAALAGSDSYTRAQLIDLVGTRLDVPERSALAADPSPVELVELVGAAGVTPATTVAILQAEGVDATRVAPLLPMAGVPPAEAIVVLHERWGIGRVDAAELLEATPQEMRAAGCTPEQIVAARPREVIGHLPAQPHLWHLAGGTLAVAGHSPEDTVGFITSHAPDRECFAAAVAAAIDDPTHAMSLAVRRGMQPDALATLSERYQLSPADTATVLADAAAPDHLTVRVVLERCDGDPVLATQIGRSVLQLSNDKVLAALADQPLDPNAIAELRAARPLSRDPQARTAAHRQPAAERTIPGRAEAARLLDALPAPEGTPIGADARSLLAALPEPEQPGATTPPERPHLELVRTPEIEP